MLEPENFKKILKAESTENNKAVALQLVPEGDDFKVAGVFFFNKSLKLPIQVMYN